MVDKITEFYQVIFQNTNNLFSTSYTINKILKIKLYKSNQRLVNIFEFSLIFHVVFN